MSGEIKHTGLPWKLEAQSKGFQKAYTNFTQQYGTTEGTRVFLKLAEEQGQGSTLRQKANSIYKKGGKHSAQR